MTRSPLWREFESSDNFLVRLIRVLIVALSAALAVTAGVIIAATAHSHPDSRSNKFPPINDPRNRRCADTSLKRNISYCGALLFLHFLSLTRMVLHPQRQ